MMRKCLVAAIILLAGALCGWAEDAYAPDTPEPGSVEAIRRNTTEARYMSPWVSYVPDSKTVPSPSRFLGHIAGEAGSLVRSAQIFAYMRELERTSPRVKTEVIGKTEEGRDILLVIVSDEANLKKLDELKQASGLLADPRKIAAGGLEGALKSSKPFYYINCAIHADESISPDMSLELVYRLAVSEQSMIRRIRENVVVLINPVANPDGRDKMADWYERYMKGSKVYDLLPRQSPPYWGKYVFVDANRDAHQLDLSTTQAVARMFFEYHPVAIHDMHEAIALLQTWNGTGPYNPNLDPIVLSEFLEMSFHEMSIMNAFGMPGVWTWNFGEGYGHHYTDSVAMNHNSIGRGYETFGNAVPEIMERKLDPGDVTREWYRPFPPDRVVQWSHRDGLNYAETGVLAVLDYTARNADSLVRAFYQKSYNSLQKGRAGNPYGFVIPAAQPDRRRVAGMVNRLMIQGIEVQRAQKNFSVKEGSYSAGDYIVRLDQPYRNYAVDLLLPQQFPENAEYQPYDDVSWALPVHDGVDTIRIDDAALNQVAVTPVTEPLHPQGSVAGNGPVYLLADRGQEALLAARFRLAAYRVKIAGKAFTANGREYPAGSWILPSQEGLREALVQTAQELALDFDSAATEPDAVLHNADLPRVGVWVPWADTDMIGWIRFTLDQEKIPYTYLRDEEIRAGNLKSLVDVIIFGNVLMGLEGEIHGIAPTAGPMAFKKTPETPSLGTPAESDDITGGIGYGGVANLQKFAEEGGVFITLGRGSILPMDSGMVRNVKKAELQGVSTPGVELRVRFTQPDSPIAYGYPQVTSAFRNNFDIYDPPRRWLTMAYCTGCLDGPLDFSHVVLQWGTSQFQSGDAPSAPMLVSGGGKKIEELEGRPAILDVPTGKGRIVVYNFNPMYRDLNHSDFRFLWNAILNWSYLVTRP